MDLCITHVGCINVLITGQVVVQSKHQSTIGRKSLSCVANAFEEGHAYP